MQACHDQIADSHPKALNRLNQGFAARNDAGLARALRRAAMTRDYPGYLRAMRGYVAGLGDGRGSDVPARPVSAFTGDMRNTAAIEHWLTRLR